MAGTWPERAAPAVLRRGRRPVGRLGIHDLRHTGGTLTAHSGATLAGDGPVHSHRRRRCAISTSRRVVTKIAEALSKIALGS
jgi:hypothetical protein